MYNPLAMKFFRSRKFIFLLVVLLGVGGFLFLRGRSGSVEVQKVDVETLVVQRTVSASGIITSMNDASLSFPLVGRLSYLAVEEGDNVEKWQYLGELDVVSAENSAQALKDARDIAIRNKELYIEKYQHDKDEIGGPNDYAIEIRKFDELISQAEASYQSSLSSLSNYKLTAPFEGTVVDISYDVGETAIAGTTVVRIADLDNLVFEVNLDQEDFGLLKVGQNVEITLDSYEDHIFTGIINELPRTADAATEDFIVDIEITSNGIPVYLGMTGDADIISAQTDTEVQALIFDSVFEDAEGEYVWVVSATGAAQKLYVETGLKGDLYTEVITDLSPFTLFTLSGDAEVNEGDIVSLD